MAHSSKEYMKEYMRDYRSIAKQLRGLTNYLRQVNSVWMRGEIIELIKEKYHLSKDDIHRLIFEIMYPVLEKECSGNSGTEINEILNVHLLHYYRIGMIDTFLQGLKHPSLMLIIKNKLEKLEQKKEIIKEKQKIR